MSVIRINYMNLIFYTFLSIATLSSFLANQTKRNNIANIYLVLLSAFLLIFIAGMRSSYNDTATYIFNYQYTLPISLDFFEFNFNNISDSFFVLYQLFLKELNIDVQGFIFVSSIFSLLPLILFIRLYTSNYAYVFMLLIMSGYFFLTMAAIKQTIAISIGVWSIHYFLKKKYFSYFIVMLIAFSFHPFALMYIACFFLSRPVWSGVTYLAFLICIFFLLFFNTFISTALILFQNIGLNYEYEYVANSAGMNTLRIMVYSIVPITSFFYRRKLIYLNNKFLNIAINFSILGFGIIIIGFAGGANFFGRAASYFEVFYLISLAYLLNNLLPNKLRFYAITASIFCYFFYFYYWFFILKPFEYKSLFFL